MSNLFKQCELHRPCNDGTQMMISWIPANVAIVGNVVRLKDSESGLFTSGWTVSSIGEPGRDGAILLRQARDYLRNRDASDI